MADQIERRPIISRAEWFLWRLADYTASDAGALFGLHPGRTLLKVWAEKSGLTMVDPDSPTFRRGRWGEAAVFAMLADERPNWEVRRASVYLRDPEIRLGATPDGAVIDPARDGIGALECKTVRRDIFERDWKDGEPPLFYQLQTLTAAMLMQASWCAIATLILDAFGGWYPHIYVMERNASAEEKIRRAVVKFWHVFDSGQMPAVNADRDAETVAQMYPKPLTKESVDLSGDNELPLTLAERAFLKGEVKLRERRIDQIETDVKAKLGVHEQALLPGWQISWKAEHVKEHMVQAKDRRVLRISKGAAA